MIKKGLLEALPKSVVKLFTVVRAPDHNHPWTLGTQRYAGGSGCIVAEHRILTNAHVVAHHLYIQALKSGDSRKYTARVLHVDHDRELALLTVDDPSFFEGTIPAVFGGIPSQNATVSVFGFPVGGNELCVTTGVVSRIEARTYAHSQRYLLALQTDAAVNPGNSGGPMFADGKLIGIVFQSYQQQDLQRSGYVVPIPIIESFFDDLSDGVITGVPDLGIYWQKTENNSLREHAGLTSSQTGVLVSRVVHSSSADGIISEGDVVTAINQTPLGSDGSISLDGRRLHFTHLVSRQQVGDSLLVDVLRSGSPLVLTLVLKQFVGLVRLPKPDQLPTYYMFAGLVFVPLTYEYMAMGSVGIEKAHFREKYYYYDRLPSKEHKEIVLLNQILAHGINVGYHQMYGVVVERVNGVTISEMRDVVRAFKNPIGKHHVIEIENHGVRAESPDYHSAYGRMVIIDAESAARATSEIMGQHGIASDRSPDLREPAG